MSTPEQARRDLEVFLWAVIPHVARDDSNRLMSAIEALIDAKLAAPTVGGEIRCKHGYVKNASKVYEAGFEGFSICPYCPRLHAQER